MSRRNGQRKLGTTRGSPRRTRTAKASRISCCAVKSRCACEWGGWGRLSDEGPGQHNPDRSEDPWGRATWSPERRCTQASSAPALIGECCRMTAYTKGGGKLGGGTGMLGASSTEPLHGKAPSERPALKPYWGKPAVRNFRGGDGNVGIIRSPVRAIALPDKSPRPDLARGWDGQPPSLLYNGILAPVSLGAHPRSSPHLDAASHLGTAFFPPRPC
jgi:hypothetical protein